MENKYFDAAAMLTAYQKDTGSIASQYLAAAIMELEPIINKAFHDGYVAGVKSALATE
jgi:hypothetical protein